MKKLFFVLVLTPLFTACDGHEPLNLNNAGGPVVAFGDSITHGYGATQGNSYPDLLAKKTARRVINLGVSGDTALMGKNRMHELREYNPYMVLIEFSGNDVLKNRPFDETKQSLSDIVDYVQNLGAVAILIDTGGNFKMTQYSKFMKELAKEKRAVFVPAIMKGIFTDRSLKADTVHPNDKGYKIIADKVYDGIKQYL